MSAAPTLARRRGDDPALPLGPGEVHLWYADAAALDQPRRQARALRLLSPDERARYEGLLSPRARRAHLTARALVRTVLSRHAPVPPRQWRFTSGSRGRPEIAGSWGARLRFSVSHKAELVACAVTRERDVGVDLEDLARPPPLAVADHHFSTDEARQLRALPATERPQRFFTYWTLKEAYAKARGLGLALPFDRVRFDVEPGRAPRVSLDPTLDDDGGAWQFMQHRPTARHLAALCARRDGAAELHAVIRWQTL